MIQVFIGYDHRQPISYQVLHYSIIKSTSAPVSVAPLKLDTLPISRQGLTPFTFSRFMVPWLCSYEGHAIFMDADMLVTGDIAELWALRDEACDVQVVKNKERFEWPSMMIFNNKRCKSLTPEYVQRGDPFSFEWARNVGDLPPEWNHLVGYDKPKEALPKLIHYTAGMPCFEVVRHLGYADEWAQMMRESNSIAPYEEIMGDSVHVERLGLNR